MRMTEAKKVKKAPKPKLSREEKAQLIFDGIEGRSVTGSIEEDFVTVNSKGGRHNVRLFDDGASGECDCPDYQRPWQKKGGSWHVQCKHIIAAQLLHAKQTSPSLASEELDRSAYEMI